MERRSRRWNFDGCLHAAVGGLSGDCGGARARTETLQQAALANSDRVRQRTGPEDIQVGQIVFGAVDQS